LISNNNNPMKTPTPTPRTDAATYPADCLGKTLVTNRDCSRALETELGALTGAYTCTHHNDQQRASCPVCLVAALAAERDELRAECSEAHWAAHYLKVGGKLEAERDQLRVEVERLTPYVSKAILTHGGTMLCSPQVGVAFNEQQARAEKAEAELAKEREKAERYRLATLRLDAELATEREGVRVLRSALENLCDEQNGAPLETRRDQWQLAMDEARAALAATEDAK
jgi:hypothetical protein